MPIASVVIVTLWPLSAIPLTEVGVVSVAQGFQANGRDSVRYLPDFRAEFVKASTAELRSWHCRVQLHRHNRQASYNFEAAPPRAFVHTASMSMRSSLAGRFRGHSATQPLHDSPATASGSTARISSRNGTSSGSPNTDGRIRSPLVGSTQTLLVAPSVSGIVSHLPSGDRTGVNSLRLTGTRDPATRGQQFRRTVLWAGPADFVVHNAVRRGEVVREIQRRAVTRQRWSDGVVTPYGNRRPSIDRRLLDAARVVFAP